MNSIKYVIGDDNSIDNILQALQLDRISYPEQYQLSESTCIQYYKTNQNIYITAQKNNVTVGYINFSPITYKMFYEIKSGNTIDTVITADDIVPYQNNSLLYGYFSSIVVSPEYRGQGVARKLTEVLMQYLYSLAVERNIYFQEIVADAISTGGTQVLKDLGFDSVMNSSHESNIMMLCPFSENVIITELNKKLIDVYRKRGTAI